MMAPELKRKKLTVTKIIFLSFIGVILFGTILLSTPFVTVSGRPTAVIDALFTATTSVCVTGLTTLDTGTHWNLLGQSVILLLIQIGGLGLMTFVSILSYMVSNKISLQQRRFLSEAANTGNAVSIKSILRYIIGGTAFFELLGAGLLAITFIPEFGVGMGIYKSIFTSISAFCNAGIDVFVSEAGPFSSVICYADRPMVLLPIAFLIIIGGLGFFVWQDIVRARKWSKMQLHTKAVLLTSGILILIGFLSVLLFESGNPETLGAKTIGNRLSLAFFQSVTPRTAGFTAVNLADMKETSLLVTLVLMLIGGAPGSTAGGIKVSTAAILVMLFVSTVRGRQDVNLLKRRVEPNLCQKAVSVFFLHLTAAMVASLFLMAFDGVSLLEALFEVISALSTVGLSLGITPDLSAMSSLLLIFLMYFGRIGMITFTMTFFKNESGKGSIRYPEGKIFI